MGEVIFMYTLGVIIIIESLALGGAIGTIFKLLDLIKYLKELLNEQGL